MDLEVVGRHALLFDDDATAAFVNSTAALVDWNSLLIDRYDVRHLLSSPPPPRSKRRPMNPGDVDSLESELDRERYLDLPPEVPSASDQQDIDEGTKPANASGYHAVAFPYGDSGNSADQGTTNIESGFRPPFSVPESLLQNLPPTEKVHQIIARTAIFVSNHGGQSEIVLRVKQGDNPAFGFLMPDHPLHAYFRFLVDHQELLGSKSLEEENSPEGGLDQTSGVGGGGALSLLGSVYGTGEDEDPTTEIMPEDKTKYSEVSIDAAHGTNSNGSERVESSANVTQKDDAVSKNSRPSSNDKSLVIKQNHSLSTVKASSTSRRKKENDTLALLSTPADKLQFSAKAELAIVEPPSDIKRVIDKIVEFILKNGKEFEAVLAEQDVKHGRFPFLLPSNLYHPYYQKVLQKAEESKVQGKGLISEKQDKKSAPKSRESDNHSLGSDIPYDPDRKEKFKMVIGKPKKEGQDVPIKSAQPQVGVSVDAAAAAAILQAATRGIKNPKLEILSKTSLQGTSQVPSSEGGQASSFSSHLSSQPHSCRKKQDQSGEPCVSVPVAKAIAKTAAIVAADEADSSEAGLSKEEKLKAERLKRAKMFAAMIKSGAVPSKTEPLRGISVEPPDSGVSGSCGNILDHLAKEREGSLVPFDAGASDKFEKVGNKFSGNDYNERRSKRKYRARSERHDKDEEEKEEEEEDQEKEEEEERDHKSSRKKRHSRHSSHHNRDKHKHKKRRSSSKDTDSRHKQDNSSDNEPRDSRDMQKQDVSTDDELQISNHRHKHEPSSDEEHEHSRKRDRHRKSSDDKHRRSRHGYRLDSSTEDDQQYSRHRHKHERSPKDKHQHESRTNKHRKRSRKEKDGDLEEGEICSKSDQSKASDGDRASREASVSLSKSYRDGRAPSQPTQTTQVSDDLRAKIRAMLMATL